MGREEEEERVGMCKIRRKEVKLNKMGLRTRAGSKTCVGVKKRRVLQRCR